MAFYNWSTTAASNATADPSINWAEGQSPSSINDSSRAEMAVLRAWGNDISGSITTGGSSTAYTVTTGQLFDSLAHLGGQMVAFTPHTTNGATVTLAVDGLTAKPLRYGPSLELQTGMLIQGTPYRATYNSSDAVFYLQGIVGNPYGIPLGGMLPYIGTTAPNSAFVLPAGQAISRTTYATLFSLTSTTFGVGDGSTTFNVPDLRGRTIFALDNLNGSAASRIGAVVTDSGTVTGTSLGSAGGSSTHVLTTAEMPTHTHTDSGHTHGGVVTSINAGGSQLSQNTAVFLTQVVGNTASGTANIQNAGSSSAHAILPPCIMLGMILRVI